MKGNINILRILITLIILIFVIVVGFFACSRSRKSEYPISEDISEHKVPIAIGDYSPIVSEKPSTYIEHQVLALADSKREAKQIADTIGGELLSYDEQVAVIQIGVTVEEMMQMLEEDSTLPKVYPNYQNYTNQ